MRRAVALQYDSAYPAPFVLAKERGALAERMIAIAQEYGIETVTDESLSDALFMVDTGTAIPEKLFEAVAALLAYVYRMQTDK